MWTLLASSGRLQKCSASVESSRTQPLGLVRFTAQLPREPLMSPRWKQLVAPRAGDISSCGSAGVSDQSPSRPRGVQLEAPGPPAGTRVPTQACAHRLSFPGTSASGCGATGDRRLVPEAGAFCFRSSGIGGLAPRLLASRAVAAIFKSNRPHRCVVKSCCDLSWYFPVGW